MFKDKKHERQIDELEWDVRRLKSQLEDIQRVLDENGLGNRCGADSFRYHNYTEESPVWSGGVFNNVRNLGLLINKLYEQLGFRYITVAQHSEIVKIEKEKVTK